MLIPHPFRSALPGLSTGLSYVQLDGAQPSWQYPQGTKSHVAQLPGGPEIGALVGAAGVMVGSLDGAIVGEEGRQFGGESPRLLLSHPFRSALPGLSTGLSYVQLDGAQPSWQYPQGTKSHDAQLPGGPEIGALVGALVSPPTLVGAVDGAAGVMVGSLDGAIVGEEGRQLGGTMSLFEIPLLIPHPFRSALPGLSTGLSYVQLDGAQPSWQYPQGTKSHDAQLPGGPEIGALVGVIVGAWVSPALVGVLLGAVDGGPARQSGGTIPKLYIHPGGRREEGLAAVKIPLLAPHPFRSVLPGMSTSLSYTQLDGAQFCWQCPHGNKSHDAQLPRMVGVMVGALVGILVSPTLVGALVGELVGSLVG